MASSATLLSSVRVRLRWMSSSSKVSAPMDAPACARTAPAVSALGVRMESAGRHTDHRHPPPPPPSLLLPLPVSPLYTRKQLRWDFSIHITESLPPSLEAASPAGRGGASS